MGTNAAPKRGFKVRVVGEYYARSKHDAGKKVVKSYDFEANIPTLTCALNTVKNKLLTPVLKNIHSDYVSYRTYHITEITPLDEKSKLHMNKIEIQYMSRQALVDYIGEHVLPVDSRLYPSLFKLRVAVTEAKTDPDTYLKKLALRKSDLEMDLQIEDLNPGLHDRPETPANVSMANTVPDKTKAIKKNITPEKIEQQATDRVKGLPKDMIKTGEHGDTSEDEALDV